MNKMKGSIMSGGPGDELNMGKIRDAIRLLGTMPEFRKPVFQFNKYIDEIYHGDGVDRLFQELKWHPGFDPEIHKGYLVPEKHRAQIIMSTLEQ